MISEFITFFYQRVQPALKSYWLQRATRKDNDRKDAVTNRQREN